MLKRRRFWSCGSWRRKGCVILSTAWPAFFFNPAQNAVTFNPNGRLLRKVWSCGWFLATKWLLHLSTHLSALLFNPAENAARFKPNGRWVPSLLRLILIVVWMMPEATLVPQPLPLPSPSAPLRFLDRDGPLRWMDPVLDVDPPSSHGAARPERTRARFLIPGEPNRRSVSFCFLGGALD